MKFRVQPTGELMVQINLILWLGMVGVTLAPGMPNETQKWIALTVFMVAVFWEHALTRGFLTPKKSVES